MYLRSTHPCALFEKKRSGDDPSRTTSLPDKRALFAWEKPCQCSAIWYIPQIPWGRKVYIDKMKLEAANTPPNLTTFLPSLCDCKQPSSQALWACCQRNYSPIQYGVKECVGPKTLQKVFASLWAVAGWPNPFRERSWRASQRKPCTTHKECSNRRELTFSFYITLQLLCKLSVIN